MVPCLALFDTMKYIGSDVGTVGFGACMGMSGFMLAMGKRVRLPWLHTLVRTADGTPASCSVLAQCADLSLRVCHACSHQRF